MHTGVHPDILCNYVQNCPGGGQHGTDSGGSGQFLGIFRTEYFII